MNKIYFVLILLIILKSIIWMLYIPIFQAPDEASHFAYIQRISEDKISFNKRRESVTSKELVEAANILNFNWGENHPVWKPIPGNWKENLDSIGYDDRKNFDNNFFEPEGQRAKKNPLLYYLLAIPFYKIMGSSNFIYRFFALRLYSLIISIFVIVIIYLSSMKFFREKFFAASIAFFSSMQPMFSFISVSINNDILAILSTSLFIYFGIQTILTGKKKFLLKASLVSFIGILIKPILIVLFIAIPFLMDKKNIIKALIIPILTILLIFLASLVILEELDGSTNNLLDFWRYQIAFFDYQLIIKFWFEQITNGQIFKNINDYWKVSRETYFNNIFPWYWGVFGWLEATMPIIVYRILKIFIGISFIGILIFFTKNLKSKKNLHIVFFLFFISVIFVLGLALNDYYIFSTTGTPFGIQGRYLLPPFCAQMILFALGFKNLVANNNLKIICWLLIIGGSVLNIIGFRTMYIFFH